MGYRFKHRHAGLLAGYIATFDATWGAAAMIKINCVVQFSRPRRVACKSFGAA